MINNYDSALSGEEKSLKKQNLFRVNRLDASDLVLIGANLVTIAIAVSQKWSVDEVIWVYVIQNVIIGLFHFLRILSLDTTKVSIPMIMTNPKNAKLFFAGFFAIHYGFFNILYIYFLSIHTFTRSVGGGLDHTFPIKGILLTSGIFFLNHLFSFKQNINMTQNKVKNIGQMFHEPYARILPMHFSLIFINFSNSSFGLVFFLLLKTYADLVMHQREHKSE